jgi:D-amino-acid dehydrogenase
MGVTSAYFLQRSGHEVVVIDREDGPGKKTSFASGCLLTPSMSAPWNAPGVWQELLASLFNPEAALKLNWRALPTLTSWGTSFLRNSARENFDRNARNNLRLALRSTAAMQTIGRDVTFDYGRSSLGSLRIFRDESSLHRAQASMRGMMERGLEARTLSALEAVELEPALTPIAAQLAGAIHSADDATGDAHRFCAGLAWHVRDCGGIFHYGCEVQSLEISRGGFTGVRTSQGTLVAHSCVVAAGSDSAALMRRVGIKLPIRPVKGYSVSFRCRSGVRTLRTPVIDDALHAAVVPLNGVLRVAGIAEFAGANLTIDPVRVRSLLMLLPKILPQYEQHLETSTAQPWCGLRPMTADGVPIIGRTRIPNLYLNTGHGHLGWTLAVGSAELLAAVMLDGRSELEPISYSLARFGSAK